MILELAEKIAQKLNDNSTIWKVDDVEIVEAVLIATCDKKDLGKPKVYCVPENRTGDINRLRGNPKWVCQVSIDVRMRAVNTSVNSKKVLRIAEQIGEFLTLPDNRLYEITYSRNTGEITKTMFLQNLEDSVILDREFIQSGILRSEIVLEFSEM